MKHFITLILIVVPFILFSQEVTETKVKKSKLTVAKTLNEIFVEIPADAKILSFEMSSGNGAKSITITGNNGEMDDKKINFFKNIKSGSLVYIDLKTKDNEGRIMSRTSKIKIVD